MGQGFAVLEQRLDELGKGNFLTNPLKLGKVDMTGVPDYIRGGLELDAGAVVDSLGLEMVLETAQTPIADVILVEMFSRRAELFDDELVRDTIFEHAVDLLSEFEWQARDFPVAAGVGLGSAELIGEAVMDGVWKIHRL